MKVLEPKYEALFIHPENKKEGNIHIEDKHMTSRKPFLYLCLGKYFIKGENQ